MPKEREGPIIANQPIIYAISDFIGETSESVVRATTSQFVQEKFDIIRVPYVNSIEQIDKIVQEAKESNAVICYTIVSPEIRAEVARKTQELNVTAVDILGPVLTAIEKTSGLTPKNQPGLIHALDHEYFKRVAAVEFAIKYDDGKNPWGLTKADLVIIGVSRTSKTPLSMYLANKQLKVANVPLVRRFRRLRNFSRSRITASLVFSSIHTSSMRSVLPVLRRWGLGIQQTMRTCVVLKRNSIMREPLCSGSTV